MCGIILHKSHGLIENDFKRSLKKLSHRGPDGLGFKKINNVFIGHTRLSIIDLSEKGLQPMTSNCDNYTLSFNGEIYNYKNIKSTLIQKGYKFVSESDTEVILYGYKEYGNKIFKMLNGIFSIILYNKIQDKIIIARDSFGVKPLYYHISKTQVILSSEIKVFDDYCNIDQNSKILFLSHGYIPSPMTNFESVYSHTPGCYSEIKDHKIVTKKFFDLTELFRSKKQKKFDIKFLYEAIKSQLISDAKIGCFLSGGIDSSILSYISNLYQKNIETYSINFESHMDEKKYQDDLIQKHKLNNINVSLNSDDFKDNLRDFFKNMDMPTIDGFNTYFVSKLAKENNAKVAFSGIGSDEIFYGYSTFKNLKFLQFLKYFFNFIPIKILKNKFKKLDYLSLKSDYGIYLSKRGIFSMSEISKILEVDNKIIKKYLMEFISIKSQNLQGINLIDRIGFFEMTSYMEGQLLKDSDVFGMANSIEIRVPYLDIFFVEHVLQIDSASKVNVLQNKKILTDSFQNIIPESIYKRKKQGFELPYNSWLMMNGIKKEINDDFNKLKFLKNVHWSKIWALYILKHKY